MAEPLDLSYSFILRALKRSARLLPRVQSVAEVMSPLLDWCGAQAPDRRWSALAEFPWDRQSPALASWLTGTLIQAPPPPSIKAFFFGMFDALPDKSKRPVPCLYVCGSDQYSKTSTDWLRKPRYMPEGRYVPPAILAALYETCLHPRGLGYSAYELLGLAYTMSLLRTLGAAVPPQHWLGSATNRPIGFGFDAGCFYRLGRMTKGGLSLDFQELQ